MCQSVLDRRRHLDEPAQTANNGHVAVFVAYFDAAGDSADPNIHVLSVAGWIAPQSKWRQLERAWSKVCEREGVSALHMKDFAHSTGEYSAWKGDEGRRQRFLSDLVKTVRRHTNRDFSQSAFLDGYRAADKKYEFHERVGHPYAICALMCINNVRDWMSKTHPKDDVLFVFEKGDRYQHELIQLLSRDKIDLGLDPQFIEKRWQDGSSMGFTRALECADFLAYEHHKTLTDAYLKQKTKARTSMWALGGEGNLFAVKGRGNPVVDGRFFELLAQGFNLPERVGALAGPIPHEFDVLEATLKDQFHRAGSQRQIRIVPRPDPLPKIRA